MNRRIPALGVVLAAAALAACGDAAAPAAPAPTVVPVDNSGEQGVLTVALNHMPHGIAVVSTAAGGSSLSVEVRLYGLVPGSTHPAALASGSCLHQGSLLQQLSPVIADSEGAADVTTPYTPASPGIPDAAWYVEVLNGPTTSTPGEAEPLVCGDVLNSDRAGSVNVPLTAGPPPPSQPGSPDQAASGHVNLKLVKGGLELTVAITDLTPRSVHAASLGLGSCDQPGAVRNELRTLTADADGYAHSTTTIPGVTSIPVKKWFVVVRRTASTDTQTELDPILCGDIGGQTGV